MIKKPRKEKKYVRVPKTKKKPAHIKMTRKPKIRIAPTIKKAPQIVKKIAKKIVIVEIKQPEAIFYGTGYEKKIMDICAENEFPFDYRRAKIDGKVVDFINRTKRLIIEVYNPERCEEEVQTRLRAFFVQRFKTKYITKDKFLKRDWRKSFVVLIKRFLE